MIAGVLLAAAFAFTVTTDMPAGNAVVERIDQEKGEVFLRPDCRGMADAWFWWACRVRGAGWRRLTFRFPPPSHPNKMCVGSLGPSVSFDGGRSWRWLNPEGRRDPNAFTLDCPQGADDVRLAFAPPYTARDWPFRTERLTTSREGRSVPITRFGGGRRWRIFLTARHHACESTASLVLEGAVAALMQDPWIAANARVEAIPFMDVDGVENGEQGKGRLPHDHNRDYVQFAYPETRALRDMVENVKPSERMLLIDFHDPLAGTVDADANVRHDNVFSFGPREPEMAARWNRYRELLAEETSKGALRYTSEHDVPYGTGANTERNYRGDGSTESASRWFRARRGAWLSFAQEIGFSRAGGVVTPRSARELGAAVARAVSRLLKEEKPTVVLGGTMEAVRAAIEAKRRGEEVVLYAPRPYLGEDRAGTYDLDRHADDDPADPIVAEMFNPTYGPDDAYAVAKGRGWRAAERLEPFSNRTVRASGGLADRTTPFLVKRTLDRALLAAGVDYLTGAVAADVVSNRVTVVARGVCREVDAARVIDARMNGPEASGTYDVAWSVVRDAAHPHVETVTTRVTIADTSPSSLAEAERAARDAAFSHDILDMAPTGRWLPVAVSRGETGRVFHTSADVVVVGGGTGGAPAAIAAARSGAKVVVVEWLNVLGGVATEGRIGGYYHGNRAGFTAEVDASMKGVANDYCLAKGEWYRRELARLGAEVWFGAAGYSVVKSGNRVAAVKVALPDGTRAEISCRVVVDATGNCDIAAAAGCETESLSADELSLQGAGVAPQPLGVTGLNSDIGFVDETSPEDICSFLLRSRLSLPDRTWNASQMVDSRERRRLVGVLRITPGDILSGRRYRDTICETTSNFDTHGQTSSDVFFVRSPGDRGERHGAQMPYRCLLPRDVDGILVTGLGVSAHRDAMPVLRMQPDIQNCGYAAGLAAAMAVKAGVVPRDIDVKELQRLLVEKGCVGGHVLEDEDAPPPDDRVFNVEACEGILARLKSAAWDDGWNFKGMSQFGRSVSDVDSMLIALGRSRYAPAAAEVVRLAGLLTPDHAYSHFRAVALAAEGCGVVARDRRRLAAALHRLLAMPGVAGHSRETPEPVPGYSDAAADLERGLVLRELSVARALYALGDDSDAGRRALRAYLHDFRRVYANHAALVLAKEHRAVGFYGVSDAAESHPSRGGFATPPVGWMTWYAVRFNSGEDVVMRNARAFQDAFGDCLAEKPVLWVDWEWCHAGFKRGSAEGEDMVTPRRSLYPRGMAPLADDLRRLGFVPALWMSAVSDVRTNSMFAANAKWMQPPWMTWCGSVWGDPTADGFCERHVPELFDAYLSWGYEAFKWDTLPHAMISFDRNRPALSDPSCGGARDILRKMTAAGRKTIGNGRYLLSCSGETDASVEAAEGIFDAARVGGDVWTWDDFAREGVDRFLKYSHLHGRALWCDMDCLVLREPFSTVAQSRTRLTLSSLFGVPLTLGDEIAALDGARVDMARKVFPTLNVRPCGSSRRSSEGVFPVTVDFRRDWGEWQVVAFANFDTNRMQLAVFDAGESAVWDFWREELVSATGGHIVLEVPPGDTRLVRITPRRDNGPTLIGTTRHVSQGGVEVASFAVLPGGKVSIVPEPSMKVPFDAVLLMPDGKVSRQRVSLLPQAGGESCPTQADLRRMLQEPDAFDVGRLPPRATSWPSRRLEIGDDEWLFDIDDWRIDIGSGWRWTWRPAADDPPELSGFERPSFDDSGWEAVDLPSTWEALGRGTPLYINSGWPFPKTPPCVPTESSAGDERRITIRSEPNPTARLRRRFDLPDGWAGRETRLWIGAAQAAVAVWCNGAFVGFSQGGADAAEFDISRHVKGKGNVLALQVFKYAAGSYLEDQDAWRVSGVYREVLLYSVPHAHVEDAVIVPDFAGKSLAGEISVANPPPGGTVEFRAGDVLACAGAAEAVRLSVSSPDFREWNPESPALIPARIVLRDASGEILDVRHFRTALRSSSVSGGVYALNGRPFKFQGVNRHEFDPVRFRAVTRGGMLRDARMIKEANFNAVRTSHYTQHPLWYEICDRVGLAVMAEANLESHGLSYHKCVLPGDDKAWERPALDRMERMVRTLRNHPCVVMWSLGNEAGYGSAFEKGAAAVRGLDAHHRPIQYADMNAVADFDSQTYPTVAWLRDWLAGKAVRKGERGEAAAMRQHGAQPSGKPYLANEYAHAMGNSTGNFAEYWRMFDSSPRFAGGFVWEWCEHGVGTWLYGGDFGDRPNGGNFCCDGLVRADRVPNPGLEEVRRVQQPLAASIGRKGGSLAIRLRNRHFFTALDPARHSVSWTLLSDGQKVSSGKWLLPRVIGPGETWAVPVEGIRAEAGEGVLRMRLLDGDSTLAECEAVLGGAVKEPEPCVGSHPVFAADWKPVFDRVPTDNDRGCKFTGGADAVGTVARSKDGTCLTFRFAANGEHAREGVRCILPTSAVVSVAWYGRGPGENMPDRCRGSLLGAWRTDDPASLSTAYTRPQENGERWDVRWLELTAVDGSSVRICGDRPFGFCLRPYASEALAAAHHAKDLPPFSSPPACWELTLDAAMRGVGGDNSWSEPPMPRYRIGARSGLFHWIFSVCRQP